LAALQYIIVKKTTQKPCSLQNFDRPAARSPLAAAGAAPKPKVTQLQLEGMHAEAIAWQEQCTQFAVTWRRLLWRISLALAALSAYRAFTTGKVQPGASSDDTAALAVASRLNYVNAASAIAISSWVRTERPWFGYHFISAVLVVVYQFMLFVRARETLQSLQTAVVAKHQAFPLPALFMVFCLCAVSYMTIVKQKAEKLVRDTAALKAAGTAQRKKT
jgi:hypothetical protein